MKASTLALAAILFVAGASITFAIIRWLGKGDPELSFIIGAILATQGAAAIHFYTPGSTNTTTGKAILGVVVAVTAVVYGLVLHYLFAPFKFAEVSIPICSIGAFFFPFGLFNTMWNALAKTKRN